MRDYACISKRLVLLLPALALAACDNDLTTPAGCSELQVTPATIANGSPGKEARLRINLVSRLGEAAGSVETLRSAGVRLRQNGRCYSLDRDANTRLGTVEGMTGEVVADVLVDAGNLTEITITPSSEAGGRRLGTQTLRLQKPVVLEAGTRNELFIALDSVAGKTDVTPRFVAAGPVPLDASTVFVAEPGRKGALSVQGGFGMTWPGDAVTEPTVYGIVSNDVGGVTSAYGIMPAGKLGGGVGITLPLDRTRLPQGLAMSDYSMSLAGSSVASTVKGNTVTLNALSTGAVGMSTGVPYMELDDGTRISTTTGGVTSASRASEMLSTCSDRLAANRATYLSRLANGNAGLRVTDCESVAPYVHIILINIGYAKPSNVNYPRVVIPAQWYSGTNDFILHTISEHATLLSGTFALINGFLWDGADGSGDGTGTPKGTLYISGQRKSNAYTGAEAIIGFTIPYTTGTSASFFSKPSGTSTVNLGTYNSNAVPTTTSIIRNGACNGEGRSDRWSSMGIGNGLLVLVSSVSGYTAYDTDLCAVYQGLNVMGGAIRLDGGPSAAIWWLNTHLNPLTGASSLYYGSARHIAYSVGAIY